MFTDVEIGLSMRYDAELRQDRAHAQQIIDSVSTQLIRLRAVEKSLRAELGRERARRIAAEVKLEELLDTEI